MSFKAIGGQGKVGLLLEESFRQNRLPHALLFAGPAGADQRRMALEFAKLLFCEACRGTACRAPVFEPCGVCVQCRQVENQAHPDLIFVEPQKDSAVIKVEEIRAVIAKTTLKPYQAPAKVFVIDPAEAMNEISQNALLKTLEEPEAGTYFILLSYAPEKLLATVRSRLQTFNFLPPEQVPVTASGAEKQNIAALKFILGRLRADPGTLEEPDFSKVERAELAEILDFLIGWFREALVLETGGVLLPEPVADRDGKLWVGRELDEVALTELVELFAETKEKILKFTNVKLSWAVLKDRLGAFKQSKR